MSQTPSTPPLPVSYSPTHPAPTNGVGTFGFIISLVGLLLTCGFLSPLGLLISFFGLFKAPRGLAIAGTVLGLVGSGVLATFGMAMLGVVMLAVGVGQAAMIEQTKATISSARGVIEQHRADMGQLPDGVEGNKLILQFKDAWKRDLHYEGEQGASKFVIRSAGMDGKLNTEDDVVVGDEPTLTTPDIDVPMIPSDLGIEMPGEGEDAPAPEIPSDPPSDSTEPTP